MAQDKDDDARREEDERTNELLQRFREAQAIREAEQQAKRVEAERLRAAEEEKRLAEQRAMEEAVQLRRLEEEARRQDAERRRLEDEARRREEDQERARQEAEQARKDAEEAALKQARAREAAAALRAAIGARLESAVPPGSVRLRRIIGVLVLLVLATIIGINFVPIDASSFEATASARFGTPVRVTFARLSTIPLPALRFEHVAIGPEGEVRIAEVRVKAGLRTILDERKRFSVLELEGVQVPASWIGAAIWGKAHSETLDVERIVARGVKIEGRGLVVPTFDVDAKIGEGGALQSLRASTADRTTTLTVTMKGGHAVVEHSAKPFKLPFGGEVQLDDLVGVGTLTRSELVVSKFDAGAMGGTIGGTARLRWAPQWVLEGEYEARSMDPELVVAKLVSTGRLESKGTFSMRAPTLDKLHDAGRLDGAFTVYNGTLGVVDLTRHLQGAGARGGTTAFTRMDGNATLAGGSIYLRQVRIVAGLLTAHGEAVIDPQKNLSGRFQVEVPEARSGLSLSGTLAAPQVKR